MSTAWVVILTGLSGLWAERVAGAGDGCLGEGALSSRDLGTVAVANSPVPLGSWHLPVSASQAPKTSAAEVRMDLVEEEPGVWRFQFYFSFIDPTSPWGIPYSFQKIRLTWESLGQPRSLWVDWSQSCSAVGHSLYPGQAWSVSEKILESELGQRLDHLQAEIYGSRN